MEISASMDAYKAHIKSPHFRNTRSALSSMVKSLELVEVDPYRSERKCVEERLRAPGAGTQAASAERRKNPLSSSTSPAAASGPLGVFEPRQPGFAEA